MIDPEQLRIFVVRPTLEGLGLWTEAAENLVMGTAAQESHLTYIDQKEPSGRRPRIGPGLGLWQMEGPTHDDIWTNYLRPRPALARTLLDVTGVRTADAAPFSVGAGVLVYNLRYGAAMCRIHYRRVQAPLPGANDIAGLAGYWKAHYNTRLGAGRPEQFTANYARFIGAPA
jgi:hypothetical protein